MTKLLDPIYPGEILLEEFMKPLELSPNALARALRVPPRRINEIVQENRAITADTALRLSRFLGTTAEVWTGLQASFSALRRDVQEKYHAPLQTTGALGFSAATTTQYSAQGEPSSRQWATATAIRSARASTSSAGTSTPSIRSPAPIQE